MSTFISILYDSFDARWNEIGVLLSNAELNEHQDKQLFDALCRSAIVLLLANFEGFIVEAVKAIIDDINRYGNFKDVSFKMKETFCSSFIDTTNKGNYKRLRRLIEVFDQVDVKITKDSFVYENGKNPKYTVLESQFNKLGGTNFFNHITECYIYKVFENNADLTVEIITKLKQSISSGIQQFPYNINLDGIGFSTLKRSTKESLWKAFIDDALTKRHMVAHGQTTNNDFSILEIKDMMDKIKVLQLSFLALSCHYISLRKVSISEN